MLMKQNVNNDVTKDSPKPCKKRISAGIYFCDWTNFYVSREEILGIATT